MTPRIFVRDQRDAELIIKALDELGKAAIDAMIEDSRFTLGDMIDFTQACCDLIVAIADSRAIGAEEGNDDDQSSEEAHNTGAACTGINTTGE